MHYIIDRYSYFTHYNIGQSYKLYPKFNKGDFFSVQKILKYF